MGIKRTPPLPTMGAFALGLMLAVGIGGPSLAAQGLPPAIEADRLLLQAEQQMQDEDFGAALETLDRIIALQTEHNLELPPAFWFSHARVAMGAGLPEEAMASAIRYLEVTGQEGEHYVETLELFNQAERLAAQGIFRDCPGCPAMVEIPPGSFMMGSPATERGRHDSEGPRHRVTIASPFAVGIYEVTFAEWEACVAGGGCEDVADNGGERGTRPVTGVSWEDAQGYVRWLSRETRQRYRLLTEAEWEYVARAGAETARYWGESTSVQCRYENGSDVSAAQAVREGRLLRGDSTRVDAAVGCDDGFHGPAPVGSYEPNAFGLYDVLGNVSEWTEDCWNETYAGAPTDGRAWRSGDCSLRVLRGGSWSRRSGQPPLGEPLQGPCRGPVASSSGSVWPGPSIEPCILTSLPPSRGSRGQRPLVAAGGASGEDSWTVQVRDL